MTMVTLLYIHDSCLLLHSNEGILISKGKNKWVICFGSDKAGGMGKELFLPNPFFPHRPMFRLSWQFEGSFEVENGTWAPPINIFAPLAPMIWGMIFALFFFLPVGLFTKFGDKSLLLAGGLLYLSVISSLSYLWFQRAQLNLSRRRFIGLAFESMVCPPFGLNLIRKVSAGMQVKEDLVNVARRLQKSSEWSITRSEIVNRLDEKIEFEDEDSIRLAALKDHRRKLVEEGM
ncbi:hypothetical protein [Nitrosospira multiformis]|nr:hypothetical protein [Nitrosospira multiformis]